MTWISDKLPEENRILLLYDMIRGLELGYYDAKFQMFYTLDNEFINNVSGWIYVPDRPNSIVRVIDTVRQNNFVIDTIKKSKGGTKEDV